MTLRKRWFSNEVVSSEGFSVKVLSRGLIVYRERGLKVLVGCEMLGVDNRWLVYSRDMRIGSLRSKNIDDDNLRSKIFDRVREAMEFLGLQVEEA